MPPAKAAVPRESAADLKVGACPIMDKSLEKELDACVASARVLGRGVISFLDGYSDEAKAEWLKGSVEAARVAFQPWAMEILFVLAVTGRTRFGELQSLLGISSRTLSDKLQMLQKEGLVEREVHDEQPVRIEYRLTRDGKVAAALATPLFGHLHRRANG